jgi:hypothetical protein
LIPRLSAHDPCTQHGICPEPTALVLLEFGALAAGREASRPVPAIVVAAGDRAARRFLEFFATTIEAPNTREAYFHSCRRFLALCDVCDDGDELVDIEPMHVAGYIKTMGKGFEKPKHRSSEASRLRRVRDEAYETGFPTRRLPPRSGRSKPCGSMI